MNERGWVSPGLRAELDGEPYWGSKQGASVCSSSASDSYVCSNGTRSPRGQVGVWLRWRASTRVHLPRRSALADIIQTTSGVMFAEIFSILNGTTPRTHARATTTLCTRSAWSRSYSSAAGRDTFWVSVPSSHATSRDALFYRTRAASS